MIPEVAPAASGPDGSRFPIASPSARGDQHGPSAHTGEGVTGVRNVGTPTPTSQEREHDVLALCGQRRTWAVDRDCGCRVCEVLR